MRAPIYRYFDTHPNGPAPAAQGTAQGKARANYSGGALIAAHRQPPLSLSEPRIPKSAACQLPWNVARHRGSTSSVWCDVWVDVAENICHGHRPPHTKTEILRNMFAGCHFPWKVARRLPACVTSWEASPSPCTDEQAKVSQLQADCMHLSTQNFTKVLD